MKWDNIIKPAEIMTEEQAKAYMDSRETSSYQLLDVRLHEEYEEEHLPGATLVPLNELMEGAGKLDPEKPTIVYCRSGGRSRAASQWLVEQGFKEVYDISSNIVDWLGLKLEGEYDYDLNLIKKDVEFPDAFALAYAMEEGLQKFYLELEKSETDEKKRAVYKQLAGYEDLHKENLKKGFEVTQGGTFDVESALNVHGDVIEGGDLNKKSPFAIVSQMKNIQDIYSLSLAIEAQSFDLYVRLANKADKEDSKALFLEMADEEKTHMNYVTEELTKYLQEVA